MIYIPVLGKTVSVIIDVAEELVRLVAVTTVVVEAVSVAGGV